MPHIGAPIDTENDGEKTPVLESEIDTKDLSEEEIEEILDELSTGSTEEPPAF